MLQSSSRPYVCWRCLSRSRRQCGVAWKPASGRSNRPNIASRVAFASTQSSDNPTAPPPGFFGQLQTPSSGPRAPNKQALPIRERLRQWAMDNEDMMETFEVTSISDHSVFGKAQNSMLRPQTTVSSSLENIDQAPAGMSRLPAEASFSKQDFEVGVDSRQPGDLVELRAIRSRTPIFAVYLGFFGSRHHFYGSQGRWIMSLNFGSLFTVSNFASAAELQPILDEMPKCSTTEEFEQAQQDDKGPSRAAASALIERMNRFKTESQEFYSQNMDRLDRARPILSDPDRIKYLSLFEITEILVPSSLKEDGSFSPAALYAVHTALYRDEIAFRPLSPTSDCHRRDHLFEVFPHSFSQIMNRVATMVRNYWMVTGQMTNPSTMQALSRTPFGSFIDKARGVVESNRQRREWVNGGIRPSNESTIVPEVEWSQSSWEIISYLQWWASYDLFEPGSRFSAYGSVILRVLNLYDNVPLDQSTAWTFLQELGVIPLWEVPSRYKIRFPNTGIVKGGGLARSVSPNVRKSLRADIAAEYRVDMPEQKVFCIDGPGAVLIDDGVSLEHTEQVDEFWIHVHAADPASGIQPDSDLSKYMEIIPENIYLPGHFQAMLSHPTGGGPQGEVQDLVKEYSLAPGGRALTFSAKVNYSGDILDYKVQPTSIHDVAYMDPRDVSTFCKEPRPPPSPTQELSVGTPLEENTADLNRKITTTATLDQPGKDALLTLYRLAEALKGKRMEKGAWPYFFPASSVEVQFQPTTFADGTTHSRPGFGWVPPDPYIKITTEQDSTCSIVANLMVLAGQVAARWCSDRKIPVPYRKDTKSAENYDEALRFATEVVYPQINKGVEPTRDQRAQLAVLTGGVQISTTPGPHFMMGIDMYAKATSPLRRFSDLLVHWQIHAALAYEHRTQRRINPDQDESLDQILPFPEEQLANTVSLLHMREKMARSVSRGDKDWILMALARAWRFEGNAPNKFQFTVTSRRGAGLYGYIDMFKLDALIPVEGVRGLVLMKDSKAGDEFDVEIEDISVHSREIRLRALQYYPKTTEEPPAQIAAAA